MHVDRISMELPIMYFKGSQLEISKIISISVMKSVHYAASRFSLLTSVSACKYPE